MELSSDLTIYVTKIQEFNRELTKWEDQLKHCKAGERLLKRQQYQWPEDWLWVEQVEEEWSYFVELLSECTAIIDD